jgi:alkanesulfonate monooxygenase SsuD/methylene tetrahydromethanopterin reductase-like flavin-dependent oxidoreductase (luciferase family)
VDFGIILGDSPASVSSADHFDSILRQVDVAQRIGMNHILIGQHFMFEGSRWLQPVPVLARLAAEVDANVHLVTQVMIAPLYHPVLLAEELATLDIVTEGRLIVGLGLGYLRTEYDVLGVPFEQRGSRLDEIIELLKLFWTSDRVNFHGRYWQFNDVPVHIHPVQRPYPPIWIGAASEAGVRRAARVGAHWPIRPQETASDLPKMLRLFSDARVEAGLPPSTQQPLRREIMVGADRDDALAKAVRVAGPSFVTMAKARNPDVTENELLTSLPKTLSSYWVLGNAAECARELREIGQSAPVNPVITRSSWPGMTTADSVSYLERLGEELVPMMREFQPVSGI